MVAVYKHRYRVMDAVQIPLPAKPVCFLDQLRAFIRLDGKTYATERTYVYWVIQFIRFRHKRHPQELTAEHVEGYLSYLALQRNVALSTRWHFFTTDFCSNRWVIRL